MYASESGAIAYSFELPTRGPRENGQIKVAFLLGKSACSEDEDELFRLNIGPLCLSLS